MTSPALNGYREAFERMSASEAETWQADRQHLMQKFLAQGFPARKEEAWKYTDISSLATAKYSVARAGTAKSAADFPRLSGLDRLTFLNGQYQAKVSDVRRPLPLDLPEKTPDSITALNAALAYDGLNLTISAGTRMSRPLHVLVYHQGDGAIMAHLRHRIVLEENAAAEIILHFSGQGRYFTTQVIDVYLAAGARLVLHRLQEDAEESTGLTRVDAYLQRDAQLLANVVELGGGLIRHDFNVLLDGPGGEVSLYGLYAPAGTSHIDIHSRIEHRAPRCRSRELFRGIASGRGRGVYDGLVVVAEGAVKTDSEQHIANLLLSPGAEIDAKPELEIYNDDVRCSHGAATGQLDEAALFYLRSRGINLLSARELLTRSFALKALEQIDLPVLRNAIESRLDQRLHRSLSEETTA